MVVGLGVQMEPEPGASPLKNENRDWEPDVCVSQQAGVGEGDGQIVWVSAGQGFLTS